MSTWKRFVGWVNGDERERWNSPPPARAKEKEKKAPKEHHKLNKKEKDHIFQDIYHVCGGVVALALLVVLLLTVVYLPTFGDPANPTNNELSQHYIEYGLAEAGATNLVANMILSYRVFDTFGESSVLFLAAASVMMLLTRDNKNTSEKLLRDYERENRAERIVNDRVLRSITRLLLPVIFTYGVYVILNGHLSPGGGFAGGSVLGAGLILYAQEFGTEGVRHFFSEHLYHIIKVTALAVYGLLLIYYAFTGVNGLESHIWLGIPGTIISSGIIMPINFMVGFEVACTIYAFYALFHKGEI